MLINAHYILKLLTEELTKQAITKNSSQKLVEDAKRR